MARVAAARPPGTVVGIATDEVADPVNEPVDVYRATAARLDTQLADRSHNCSCPHRAARSLRHRRAG